MIEGEGKRLALEQYNKIRDASGFDITPPSPGHYKGATYLWDTCFVAIGRAQCGDLVGAKKEFDRLFFRQKPDGMIPNQQFTKKRRRIDPEHFTFLNPKESSDYTQPPMVAEAAVEIYKANKDAGRTAEGRAFLEQAYPAMDRFYQYFKNTRVDPDSSLVWNIHPHEDGRDSDPMKDKTKLLRLPQPERGTPVIRGAVDYANSAFDYVSTLYQNAQLRRRNWDPGRSRNVYGVKDVMFNCIYAQNLRFMKDISGILGKDEKEERYRVESKQVEEDILREMWDENDKKFHSLDKNDKKIPFISVTSLFPIILESTSKEQVISILELLDSPEWFAAPYPIPSVPMNSKAFDPEYTEKRIWRGTTWNNMTVKIIEGLLQHRDRFKDEDTDLAIALNKRGLITLQRMYDMLVKNGCWEFNNPLTGKGMRVPDFAWSANGLIAGEKIPDMEVFSASDAA